MFWNAKPHIVSITLAPPFHLLFLCYLVQDFQTHLARIFFSVISDEDWTLWQLFWLILKLSTFETSCIYEITSGFLELPHGLYNFVLLVNYSSDGRFHFSAIFIMYYKHSNGKMWLFTEPFLPPPPPQSLDKIMALMLAFERKVTLRRHQTLSRSSSLTQLFNLLKHSYNADS